MQLNEQILNERWVMLTNSLQQDPLVFTELTETEITEHLLWIDAVTVPGGRRCSDFEMQRCRTRFVRSCGSIN